MNEREFLQKLQAKAAEQEQAMHTIPFFAFVAKWLSVHPWRYLIPLAFLLTLLLRGFFGSHYTDAILWLFRANTLLEKL